MEGRKTLRVALMIALCAAAAVPCSFDDTPAFAFRVRPDDPIEEYVNGRIGIIGKEFARSHLVTAYRWLSGTPPTDAERQGFLDLVQHRLKQVLEDDHSQDWDKERAAIRGVQPEGVYTARTGGNYAYFENCTADGFLKAVEVLRDRSLRFGAKSPAFLSWLEAQETVFANCREGVSIPKPADPSLPAMIKADRAYQIASANFYATQYDEARAQFLAIAGDAGSPWRQIARVVAARALLRKATVTAPGDEYGEYAYEREPMEQAEKDLTAILADPAMKPFHEQARSLLHFAVFRLRPEERLDETAAALLKGTSANAREARMNLADYTLLLDKENAAHDDDLTNWITAFQSGADATAQWRATKKLHWLVAALAAAGSSVPRALGSSGAGGPEQPSNRGTEEPGNAINELLDAAGKVGPDSVAYPMVAFHRARLFAAMNKRDAARSELDRVLALKDDKLPPSSRNLLLEQRRALARSLADYLRDAQIKPVGSDAEQAADPEMFPYPLLPPDAADVIDDAMPLDVLAAAAQTEMAVQVRRPILVAAWTRAILLGREDVAKTLAPAVIAIDASVEQPFNAWLKASGNERRRYAAADLIVHFGGLSPRVKWYGGRLATDNDLVEVVHGGGVNWWCVTGSNARKTTPPFLSDPATAGTAATEQLALMELGAGTTFVLRSFIDLANASPKDPRVAEGLSLAVKGTRWACGDSETNELAERAFNLLHKRYGSTTWAKETPYWYRSGF